MVVVGYFAFSTFFSLLLLKISGSYKPRILHSAAPCGFGSRFPFTNCLCASLSQPPLEKDSMKTVKQWATTTLCQSVSAAFCKKTRLNAILVQTGKRPAHLTMFFFCFMCHKSFRPIQSWRGRPRWCEGVTSVWNKQIHTVYPLQWEQKEEADCLPAV